MLSIMLEDSTVNESGLPVIYQLSVLLMVSLVHMF